MPPRADRAKPNAPERRALQDTLAWPIALVLVLGAVVIWFLPRVIPDRYLALAVGSTFAVVTVTLIFGVSALTDRWLRRHAVALSTDAETEIQTVGVAGLPTSTSAGALVPLTSAYADAGARAALGAAERDTNDMLARLGVDAAAAVERECAHAGVAPEIHAFASALRQVLAPIPQPVAPVDVVASIRDVLASVDARRVTVGFEVDRGMIMAERSTLEAHLKQLLMLALAASPPDRVVSVHVSRRFRSDIEESPVRRVGDSRLTIVPRSGGDALRAWVLRAQPGAEVLSIIVSDAGPATDGDTAQRAFDPFAVGRPGDPIGIVLPSLRRMMQAYKGTVWMDGSREGGSAVHLLFPIAVL
jgi:signal transduction histidine kinase